LRVKTVLVSFFKAEFYADLQRRRPTSEELAEGFGYPPGYCHFPDGKNYGDEHFKQICAEQLVRHVNKRTGRTVEEWQQLRARNEALDCRVYARAAAWDCGLDRFQERHWQLLEAQSGNAYSDKRPEPKPQPKPEAVEVTAQPVPLSPVLRSLPPPTFRRRTFARFI
jgi:phage terminase large subunit GpA-like protein